MKKYKIFSLLAAAFITLSACGDDFLTNGPTQSQAAGGPATEGAINSYIASCYQILLFDSYANNNYNSIPLMSDLRGDDIYKGGGDAGDQEALYRLSQLDVSPTEVPAGLWNIYYRGLSRCNNAIDACNKAVDVEEEDLNRYQAEAHFLRAYYVHWLWKFWGNIPYYEEELEAPYMSRQYSADEIYERIIADVNFAIEGDKLPMRITDPANEGRATKAAAMMLKARVVMYQKDQSRYAEVMKDMNEIVSSGQYKLMEDFAGMWLNEGEFCEESIFESNQRPEGKTWASGNQGYGTNLPAFISPNGLSGQEPFKGGWGFGPVRTEAYGIYEEGDIRRDASINHFPEGSYAVRFQNTGYFQAKYAAREGYNPPPGDTDLNYDNNLRIFRYAEVLLNIADLAVIGGTPSTGLSAQECLDQIRTRAGLASIPATAENIKLERRREFMGEGMRFWDLVRWGDTNILNENKPDFSSIRTWQDHCKYLPIPQLEIERTEGEFKLQQNPGY